MTIEPVTLEGNAVRLEPLSHAHAEALLDAASDEEIWRYMPQPLTTLAAIQAWIAGALAAQTAGTEMPFATVDRRSNRVVGSTRYMDIRPAHRGVEIGWTWLARDFWRSAANTECKYLLMRHAFETWGCIRVQLKTHARNERSRGAIERIGGQFEGILRQHYILLDGTYRDSAYYSILDGEWPAVKARLEERMNRG